MIKERRNHKEAVDADFREERLYNSYEITEIVRQYLRIANLIGAGAEEAYYYNILPEVFHMQETIRIEKETSYARMVMEAGRGQDGN